MVIIVGDEVVGAVGMVGAPIRGGAVAACGVENVAACGGGVEAGDDGWRGGFDAVDIVVVDGNVGAQGGGEGAIGCGG